MLWRNSIDSDDTATTFSFCPDQDEVAVEANSHSVEDFVEDLETIEVKSVGKGSDDESLLTICDKTKTEIWIVITIGVPWIFSFQL